MELPLDPLRAIALGHLAETGARPLFATLSGAHLYGFASPDSDFDIRGAHLLPLKQVVSLFPRPETVEYSAVRDGREIDLVSHDAAKFFGLMLKKNGYVMEQVFSPLVVIGGPELDELREIARGCLTRHLYHHYKGFSQNQLFELQMEPVKRIKTLLYVYRVLLTGIHVLRAGVIEANLGKLLRAYPQDGVDHLMSAKVREAADLPEGELAPHLKRISALQADMETAFAESHLPEAPGRAADLDAFLIRLRLRSPE